MMMVVGNEEDGVKDEAQVSDALLSDPENVEESADDDSHARCGSSEGLGDFAVEGVVCGWIPGLELGGDI